LIFELAEINAAYGLLFPADCRLSLIHDDISSIRPYHLASQPFMS